MNWDWEGWSRWVRQIRRRAVRRRHRLYVFLVDVILFPLILPCLFLYAIFKFIRRILTTTKARTTTTTTTTTPMVRKIEQTTQPVIGQEEVKLLEIVIGIEDEHEEGLMVERYLNDQLGLFFVDDVGGELDAPFLMV
ncbi:hypothetical protein Syun_002902 [Stephania yunnanensis]|uniref:Transmembrane protein n=1 Tax=Stephania yunnanensis TaxID=152371 RepID=A0AAP0L2R0_9MAGN